MPIVSIVMGVHNERDEHLRMALDSICNQTYKEIEVIVVDDCSNSECKHILSEYACKHNNIRIIHNEVNLGLTKSLNIGICQSTGEFIARMDADDYSVPTRIEKQVHFLIDNPDIDICGTGVVSFGDSNVYMSPINGLTNDEAQCYLFFSSTLCHPSVMLRKSFLERHNLSYDETVKCGQDYDLWERASVVGKFTVLKEVLLFYRLHAHQITSTHKHEQDFYSDQTRLRRLSRLNIVPTESEYACHMLLVSGKDRSIPVQSVESWVNRIIDANNLIGLVDNAALEKELRERLVVYKIRNHHFSRLLTFNDFRSVVAVSLARIKMKQSIKRELNKFNELTYC